MRLRAAIAICIAAVCITLVVSDSTMAAEFPYRAVINADDVYVRSGPGQDYYPTEKLKQGEVVEVYRHDPGGWFAVRPPASSYSWVSARYVKEIGDGLLEVAIDGVVARVGSTLNQARDVWQVKLRKGEVLEMLDAGPGESGSWYRVSPPSGEFRWVYGRYVDPTSGEAGLETADEDYADIKHIDGEIQPEATSDGYVRGVRPASHEGSYAVTRRGDAEQFASHRRTRDEASLPEEPRRGSSFSSLRRADEGSIHRPASYQAGSREADGEAIEPERTSASADRIAAGQRHQEPDDESRSQRRSSKSQPARREVPAGSISLELERLEAELAFAVAEGADLDQLEGLFDRAVAASDRVRNRQELEQAESLIERIRRFAALRRQIENAEERMLLTIRRQQRAVKAEKARPAEQAVSYSKPSEESQRAEVETDAVSVELVDSQFDGEGRLVPVYSKRIGAPQYALLDQENRVRSYVTSAPGVNLRAYEGRHVGIIGSRGYSAELKAPHVVAQRVEVLGTTVR